MRRWSLLVLACAVAPYALVAGADADPPRQVGWWTASNLGAPVPTIAPLGPSSDVPDGGFEVAGPGDAPTSVAALAYDLPAGAEVGPLVLRLAEGTAPAPGSSFRVCPLTGDGSFEPADGGPLGDAPAWDCAEAAAGTPDDAGTTYTFDVAGLATGEQLAVAVVPDGAARAAFAPAGDDSLLVEEPIGTSPAIEPSTSDFESSIDTPPSQAPVTAFEPSLPPPLTFDPVTPPSAPPTAPAPDAVGGPTDTPAATETVLVTSARGGLGAGSAVVGSLLVLVGGAVVLRRSRRALEQALHSRAF